MVAYRGRGGCGVGRLLTFVVIPPVFTIRWGKIYCSYICSCGALAETVGNGYRHRGPKGDGPRRLEKWGLLVVLLASVVTIATFSVLARDCTGTTW